ncbi:MAG: hypothetical protein ABI120_16040 [Gemmatimonadaceae bacterium]
MPPVLRTLFWALLLTLGASARRLPAQTPAQFVRGTVTDSASRQGIAGSIVMVTGANGTVLVRTLANERGGRWCFQCARVRQRHCRSAQ